jgi:hypothetical protein
LDTKVFSILPGDPFTDQCGTWLICRYDSNGAISFDQGMGSFAILMGRMLDLKLDFGVIFQTFSCFLRVF